jgi:ABC-type polysaccharide/polyol phosphate export permease
MSTMVRLKVAVQDFMDGAKLAPLWWRVGIEQTITRYRRTVLGPFWVASSTLATSLALSVVWGGIFGVPIQEHLPFVISGVVAWSLTGGMLIDGANTFFAGAGLMQVQKLPLSFHAFLQIDRMFINFVHQIIALWAVFLILRVVHIPHWQILLSLPLVLLTAFFFSIPLGMVALRYRDVNYMLTFIAQALFTMTPVFWRKGQMSGRMHWLADYNPFAHQLELIRQPLLGMPAPIEDWMASLAFMAFGAVLALLCMTVFRRRVVFWI